MALAAPQMAGDQLNPVDIENHTLLVIPVEFIPHLPTIHTKKDEQSPAIRCNVVDFSEPSGVPTIYRGVLWFNVQLYNGLRRQIGASVLGRMIKGQGQPGKNPPWTLLDLLSNPNEKAWVDYVEQWLTTAEGQAFEIGSQNEAANTAATAQVDAVTSGAAAGPPSAPPVASAPPAPPAPPAGPPATYAPPAGPPAMTAPGAPPAPAAAPTPAPAGDLAAQIAGLPADEVAKVLAALQNQGQAAH